MSRNRAGVKRRLVEIADHVLQHDDVAVSYTWDGSAISDNTLFLGVTTGAEEPQSYGRPGRSVDLFTIEGELRMFGFLTGEDAEAAVEETFAKFDDALQNAQHLQGVPDLEDGDLESYRGIQGVRIGQVDGPAHSFPGPQGGNTVEGWVLFSVDCRTELSLREN